MWITLKKMLKLEWNFLKISIIADLQVTTNLVIQFFNDILWYLLQIMLFGTLYYNVTELGGWGIGEMRVFLGMLFLVDAFQMILFSQNFDQFSEKIVNRDLDLLLLRPVSSQQLMTCQKLQCGFVLNAIFAFCWLYWSLSLLSGGVTWLHLLMILIVIPAGLAVFYSMRLFIATFALILTRAEHFHELYYVFFKIGQRPDRIYNPSVRYFILLIFPVGLVASVPATVLLHPEKIETFTLLIIGASASLFLSHRFWKWAVKQYMIIG